MISIRRARPSDAISIGAVHVAAWRSTYPGILPDGFLARLSVPRQAAHYDAAIRSSQSSARHVLFRADSVRVSHFFRRALGSTASMVRSFGPGRTVARNGDFVLSK